jgi:hypothetical protein
VLESLHGHLGVLAVAALVHPAILLWRGKPLGARTKLAVGLAAGLTLFALASGLVVYGDYRARVRPELFRASHVAGLLFETKEHLAFAACALALGAAAGALVAPRGSAPLRRAAAALFAVAAALALTTAGLGTYVAAVRGFWG